MAFPEVRSVGTVASGTEAITPGAPSGLEAGDLAFMVTESGGATTGAEANTALTAAGWVEVGAAKKGNTRLTLLMKRCTGNDVRVTNDTGDHQVGRIMCLKAGTWDCDNAINAQSENGTQAATKSVSIPGGTTTVAECLVIACASGHLPDASSTTEFGAATNANLASITERVDNAVTAGDGGAIYMVTGTLASAKSWGSTTLTAVTEAERGVLSCAVAPFTIPQSPYHVGTPNKAEGEATSIEISKPTGSETNDILLLAASISTEKAMSVSGGTATLIGTQKNFAGARTALWWVKHDGTATKLKVTWEGEALTGFGCSICAYRNCHLTEPVHKNTEPEEKPSSTTATVGKVTTTVANCRIVILETNPNGNEPTIVTDPWNPRVRMAPMLADRLLAAAGESAAATWTLSVARVQVVQTIALQPPSTGKTVELKAAMTMAFSFVAQLQRTAVLKAAQSMLVSLTAALSRTAIVKAAQSLATSITAKLVQTSLFKAALNISTTIQAQLSRTALIKAAQSITFTQTVKFATTHALKAALVIAPTLTAKLVKTTFLKAALEATTVISVKLHAEHDYAPGIYIKTGPGEDDWTLISLG